MRELKATPGPWKVSRSGRFNDHVYDIRAGNNVAIANTAYWVDSDSFVESRANAYLLSEAPNLYAALEGDERLIKEAQNILRMYLEPGERRIQSPEQAISALLGLLDGPKQREIQGASEAALRKARGEDK